MEEQAIDERIKTQIINSFHLGHRTIFFIVGDNAKDQIVNLYYLLKDTTKKPVPTIVWCSKNKLNFQTHQTKKTIKKQLSQPQGSDKNTFDLFAASAKLIHCFYKDTERILGNTYSMLVFQDLESITPNILCRTIETICGGGIIVFINPTIDSLTKLYRLPMDVHSKYTTNSLSHIEPRFNERLILSLGKSDAILVMDDKMNLLPISSHAVSIFPIESKDATYNSNLPSKELKAFQDAADESAKTIINMCKTIDQAKAVGMCIEELKQKFITSNIVITAPRGRGKSAALGLVISNAIINGYRCINVTAPSADNLKTLFEFAKNGLVSSGYSESSDFEIIYFNEVIYKIIVTKNHRQVIQYIPPLELRNSTQTDLLVIDEAAAIPLTIVKDMIGPYHVILSSTINGYEGTGRSLSLKLVSQLREKSKEKQIGLSSEKRLKEIVLSEPIRYGKKDPIEAWLYDLLCLDCTKVEPIVSNYPHPNDCNLYYVDKDTLFSGHKTSERFLKKIMALFVSSHYKNSPNDLQLLADAPAHGIFVLLPTMTSDMTELPDVFCAIQISYEGRLNKSYISECIQKSLRPSGDLIPWTIIEQYQDHSFGELSGIRIVRIASHPDCQSMGYGSRALKLLKDYYEGALYSVEECKYYEKIETNREEITFSGTLSTEDIKPRKHCKPMLQKLTERKPIMLHYIGTSYGITAQLYKFWGRNGYMPLYLRQTSNELTGEYTCIMICPLIQKESTNSKWWELYANDFKHRFMSLLGYEFRKLHITTVMNILSHEISKEESDPMIKEEHLCDISISDVLRLESYTKNLVDYHLVMDVIPTLARMFFSGKIVGLSMNHLQQSILLGMGLQFKNIECVANELGIQVGQALPLLNKILRRLHKVVKEAMGCKATKKTEIKKETKEIEHMEKLFKGLENK